MKYTVYSIRNTINNKIYIGSTKHFEKRIKEHLYCLKSNTHYNKPLQEDFNNYNEECFEFEIIVSNVEKEDVDNLEEYYINKYSNLYNSNMVVKRRRGFDRYVLAIDFKTFEVIGKYRNLSVTSQELDVPMSNIQMSIEKTNVVNNLIFVYEDELINKGYCIFNDLNVSPKYDLFGFLKGIYYRKPKKTYESKCKLADVQFQIPHSKKVTLQCDKLYNIVNIFEKNKQILDKKIFNTKQRLQQVISKKLLYKKEHYFINITDYMEETGVDIFYIQKKYNLLKKDDRR